MYWKYAGIRFDSSKEHVTLTKETDMNLHTLQISAIHTDNLMLASLLYLIVHC